MALLSNKPGYFQQQPLADKKNVFSQKQQAHFLFVRIKFGGEKMLGMQDLWISAAWLLSIGSAVGCVVYGAFNWHYENEEE